ncbi:MAG: lipid-A-disaccharide synthase [Bacteroidales bacterium]|jgi:lipid-A-disaccharide synthase|nr:lipid-A-disaccharide synthase [Bacteroidales bacterium]
MRFFIISGEASGDLHGANLAKQILLHEPSAILKGWGGEKMQMQGVEILKHYKDLAFMGFAEVAMHLPEILQNFALCKKQINEFKPDAVILVDYPGFNLRMAKWLHNNGYKVIYYIAPQVWAWHSSRIKQIKKYVDVLFPILPFEKQFFEKHGIHTEYFGHPLLDVVSVYSGTHTATNIIAIFPGSRKQEIKRMLPTLLKVTGRFPDKKFIIAGTKHLPGKLYTKALKEYPQVEIVFNETYRLLSTAEAAIVKSGTSTLETALFGVPEVVVYKTSGISYRIAKMVVSKKIKYISLVNLILDKKAVPELIQKEFTTDNITKELHKILSNPIEQKSDFDLLKKVLGSGNTAEQIAKKIIHI